MGKEKLTAKLAVNLTFDTGQQKVHFDRLDNEIEIEKKVFIIELSLGQFMKQGGIACWDLVPLFRGVGVASGWFPKSFDQFDWLSNHHSLGNLF